MTNFGLFKLLRLFFVFGVWVIAGSAFIIEEIIHLILEEKRYQRLYGADWMQVYEKYEEPLSRTHFKIGLGIAYVIAMCVFAFWLYRRFRSKESGRKRRRSHRA